MALTETSPDTHTTAAGGSSTTGTPPPQTQPTPFERIIGSGDHVLIGRGFIFGSLIFLVVSLVASGLADADVAWNGSIFRAAVTARLAANAQIGLLLLGVIPLLLGLAISVVPRQIGAAAVAFPRAAAAAFWGWLFSGIIFVIAVCADGSYGGGKLKAARLGDMATGGLIVSLVLASVVVAVTVLAFRPAGMTIGRVPFFSFASLAAATIWILTLPVALAHIVLSYAGHFTAATLLDRTFNDGLAWLFRSPAIFAAVIPVLGILADVVATAVGGRQRFGGAVRFFIGLFAVSSFGAWAQGSVAQETIIWSAVTLSLALPLFGLLGGLGDTLRQGRIKLIPPLPAALLAVLLTLLGVVIGAIEAVNSWGKDTLADFYSPSLDLALFRLVLGAALLGGVAGLAYWGVKLFGSPLLEAAAKGLAALGGLGVLLWAVPYAIDGLTNRDSPDILAGVALVGAVLVGFTVLTALGLGIGSWRTSQRGDVLQGDPWGGGGTLEWADAGTTFGMIESAYPVLDAKGGE